MTESKGHPHADLMLLYAQRSKTDAEDWKNWDYYHSYTSGWLPLPDSPTWISTYSYRLRPVPPMPKTLYAVISEGREDFYTFHSHKDAVEDLNRATDAGYKCRIAKFVEVLE